MSFLSFSSSKVLDVSMFITIWLLSFFTYVSTVSLDWNEPLLVFRIVAILRSFYSVLLGLSKGECYLYLFVMLIYLRLLGDCESPQNPIDPTSCFNTTQNRDEIQPL